MSYCLFLDDERIPKQVTWSPLPYGVDWVICRDFAEFAHTIETRGMPWFISFDHDLGEEHYGHGLNDDAIPYDKYVAKTGYDCAKWLVTYCMDKDIKLPAFEVHSMNPVGSENIYGYLNNFADVQVGLLGKD